MKHFILAALCALSFSACNKTDSNVDPPEQPSEPGTIDVSNVLLKEVAAQNLPSPLYHFSYDSARFVRDINFASGFFVYHVEYANGKISKMTNSLNKNVLAYTYFDGRVSEINEFYGSNGKIKINYRFSYDINGRLSQVLWFNFINNSSGDLYRKVVMTYHLDGNLATMERYSFDRTQMNLVSKSEFSNYDNGVNVDDFYLLKDGFFESLLYLPRIKFQNNNPGRLKITGGQTDYDISYTYRYHDSLPVEKTGVFKYVNGVNAGRSVIIKDQFRYY